MTEAKSSCLHCKLGEIIQDHLLKDGRDLGRQQIAAEICQVLGEYVGSWAFQGQLGMDTIPDMVQWCSKEISESAVELYNTRLKNE